MTFTPRLSREIDGKGRTVRELLAGRKYSIDHYQREYKLQQKQVAELSDDLAAKFLESHEEGNERSAIADSGHYFLGSIIISDKDGQKFIIDGQQRLTILTLLLIFLRHKLADAEQKGQIADLIFSQKFGKRSFNLDIPERAACMEALYKGEEFQDADAPESIATILARFADLDDLFPEELAGAALPYFVDWLVENVHLVEITAYSDGDVYTIFETMNDRGLSLTPADMLKGYLLANTTDADKRTRASCTWKERVSTKQGHGVTPEELETLSRIIAELNERFGLNLGPEHRVTLGRMMEKLDDDAALDAAARVNTRENVRLTFDQKVEHVIQEIVDSNFDLYKRITDDRAFGEAIKNFLFDQYLRAHRNAEDLINAGESETLEFKSTLRWSLKENRQDDKGVTHAVLKTIAAFLNTEGGDLLIGVADDGSIVGIEKDDFQSDDKFVHHLAQVVRNGLGDRAGTCVDPKCQVVQGKTVCVVSCQRSPERVFLKWKGMEATAEGDFFVRSGPGTVKLPAESAREYIRTQFGGLVREK